MLSSRIEKSLGIIAIGKRRYRSVRSGNDVFRIAPRRRLVVHVLEQVAASRDFSDTAEWQREGYQDDDAAVIDMDE
jgi:hypothetical protein